MYDREEVVRDTIQRLAARRGMATQVIWSGDDQKGFYTSISSPSGRHMQHGHYGPPTGRSFVSRTIADCMIHANKIYREWVVSDQMAIIRHGSDPVCRASGREAVRKGRRSIDIGENCRMVGQIRPIRSRTCRSPAPIWSARRWTGCMRCGTSGCWADQGQPTRRPASITDRS